MRGVGPRWGGRLLARLPQGPLGIQATVRYRGVQFRVNTSEEVGRRLFYWGTYEKDQEDALLALLEQGSVFFDIGANVGIFSLLAAQRGAKVFSFEPSRAVGQSLRRNVGINHMDDRVTVVNKAVSDAQGKIRFWETRPGNWGVGRIFAFGHALSQDAESYEVDTEKLDHLVDRFGCPHVIKMDIEGAEWMVLNAASQTLARADAPVFLIEFHVPELQALGGSVPALLDLFRKAGFKKFGLQGHAIDPMGQTWFIFAKRPITAPAFVELPS
jgi:FkbM family methyltransferase